jgi:hypothetical protein
VVAVDIAPSGEITKELAEPPNWVRLGMHFFLFFFYSFHYHDSVLVCVNSSSFFLPFIPSLPILSFSFPSLAPSSAAM